MNINPKLPSEPPAPLHAARRSFGPAVNALSIVGFVVAIALVGHQFSSSTAPAAPTMLAATAPTLPPAVLRRLRSGTAGGSTGTRRTAAYHPYLVRPREAPVPAAVTLATPAAPRSRSKPRAATEHSHPAQLALQPDPVGKANAVQAVSSVSSGSEQMSRPRVRPVEVVCTSTMMSAEREACLTARLRWANQQWRAEFRAANAAKPAVPRQRS